MSYIDDAKTTDVPNYEPMKVRLLDTQILKFLHAVMGLTTENGELMDALKKYLVYGKEIDKVNIQEELGDLFWYCAILADAYGFTFENTMDKNIEKLKTRYPNRFTEKEALFRDLEKERKVLES